MNPLNPKHILFLSSWYPSRVSKFAGDFIQRHALAASEKNQITVLHAAKDDSIDTSYEIVENQGEIREVIVYFKGSFFRPFNLIKRFLAFHKGYKKISEVDLIHLNVVFPAGVYALYLKWFKNKKYVLTEHWTGLHAERFAEINFLEKFLIRNVLKNAAIYLPVSMDLGKSMQAISSHSKIKVIPNVVDTDRFQISTHSKNSSAIRFFHISMLREEHKNISGMLRVAKRLAEDRFDFEFHIGGNGPLESIEKFILENKLEKQIQTFGTLSHKEVADKMAKYDCFILFSNYENQPCVQIEAFSSGISFIGTDVGGISEFLPEDFGILIPKGDEEALYQAMRSVCEGKSFASKQEMHEYAVENFSKEVISIKFDKIYNRILN